jgi:hypothetical protein
MQKIGPALALAVILGASFFRPPGLEGQERKTLIKINPLSTVGLGLEESYLIESLIRSYLSDFGEVMNYYEIPFTGGGLREHSPGGAELPARTPECAISGSIYLERDRRIFTLEVTKTATGETSSSTTAHRTTGELVLKARSVVEAVFASGRDGNRAAGPEALTEQSIAGTWRGEPGIEMLRLNRGGQGIAIFSSGARMALAYSVQNNVLFVIQDAPNTERFYHPLPRAAAWQLAEDAEPMRWELSLHEKGAALRGKRIFTWVRYEGETLLDLTHGIIQEVEWTRIH